MIEEQFYLSDSDALERTMFLTDLSSDEVEELVGRFARHSQRANQLRGEVLVMIDGKVIIRHHFTKKVLWKAY